MPSALLTGLVTHTKAENHPSPQVRIRDNGSMLCTKVGMAQVDVRYPGPHFDRTRGLPHQLRGSKRVDVSPPP